MVVQNKKYLTKATFLSLADDAADHSAMMFRFTALGLDILTFLLAVLLFIFFMCAWTRYETPDEERQRLHRRRNILRPC
ncbi:unnamed protein product [Calicophoron daubneyi]|uniref:Uncharacterized protein n=1 Tax=Calicophoron daubneyi TaxID=300641 RepID=A0AAV2TSZ0_CALDB